MSKITRKVINRHSKKDLIKIARENGLKVKKSTSKKVLVDTIFKNKSLRNKIPFKGKRQLSEKQRKNLEKFRFKKPAASKNPANALKNQNDEVRDSAVISQPIPSTNLDVPIKKPKIIKIDATAGNKLEPAPPSLKQDPANTKKGKVIAQTAPTQKKQPKAVIPKTLPIKEQVTDFKTGEKKEEKGTKTLLTKKDKRYRDRASFNAEKLHQQLGGTQFDAKPSKLDNHSYRIQKRLQYQVRNRFVRRKEMGISTNKSTDAFDRRVFDRVNEKNRREMKIALAAARQNSQHTQPDEEVVNQELELLTESSSAQSKVLELVKLRQLRDAGIITEEEYKKRIKYISDLDKLMEKGVSRTEAIEQLKEKKEEKKKEILKIEEVIKEKMEKKKPQVKSNLVLNLNNL